jgi:FtsZ-binding cell division protein ZapB
MKLTRAVEAIIAEDSGMLLPKHIVELEKDKDALQRTVDHGIKDYDMLVTSNKNLSSEHDELKSHCKGL